MSDLELKKLRMKKIKAEAAIAELEFKIAEREEDITRMRNHIELQKDLIKQTEDGLLNLETK